MSVLFGKETSTRLAILDIGIIRPTSDHSGSFSNHKTSDLSSDSTTSTIGSCSDRPGPEGAFEESRAESSLGTGLESGAKTSALSGSERPSSLHRDCLIDATV